MLADVLQPVGAPRRRLVALVVEAPRRDAVQAPEADVLAGVGRVAVRAAQDGRVVDRDRDQVAELDALRIVHGASAAAQARPATSARSGHPDAAADRDRPGQQRQQQQRLAAHQRGDADQRPERRRTPLSRGCSSADQATQQHQHDDRRVGRLAHQRAVDDDHQRIDRAHGGRGQPEPLAADAPPEHAHQRDRQPAEQQPRGAVPHDARPAEPRDRAQQQRVERRMAGRRQRLVLEAQPERLDVEVPVGQVVRGPVVEPPVSDARDVATDRQQVHGPQRDARRALCRRAGPRICATSAGSIPDAMSAPDGRHPPIDGLRAFAAIAVLLTHVSIYSGLVAAGGDAARYAQRLEVGVAIFFVISGFVLYRPFLQARLDARELPRVGRYAGRRALRIVPAYWLALTVAAVVLSLPGVLSSERDRHLLRLRPDLLDGHVPRRARAGLDAVRGGHLLRLPAAVGVGDAARRPGEPARARRSRCSALAAFSLAWKAAFVWSGSPDQVVLSPWLHSLPAYLDHFALGHGARGRSSRGGRCRAAAPLVGVAGRGARVLGREPADRDRLCSCSSPTRAGSGWGGTCSTA